VFDEKIEYFSMKWSQKNANHRIQHVVGISALLLVITVTVAGCSSTPSGDAGLVSSGSVTASVTPGQSPTTQDNQNTATTMPNQQAVANFEQLCQEKIGTDTHATGTVTIDHKAWGATTIVSCGPTDVVPSTAEGVLAVDSTGTVTWNSGVPADVNSQEFALANPATDASGNIFITYNPGRYDGVMILHPTDTGMEILAGSYYEDIDPAATTSYPNDFYQSQLVGPGSDGLYQIAKSVNDCVPDCASGQTTTQVYAWNGQSYETK